MKRFLLAGWFLFSSIFVGMLATTARADDERSADSQGQSSVPDFAVSDEVKDVLVPLFSAILKADVSRATVRLSAETVMNGVVVETEESTYQIASRHPNSYTIYYKSEADRKRLYCNGERSMLALSTDAFMKIPGTPICQEIVEKVPVNLGTYPEPVLSLTLAGVDPAYTFLAGMRSVDVIERSKFRGRTDSIRLRGVQDDGVTWDLWITTDAQPTPLRLLVDLTPMLMATKEVAVPRGYGHSLRYDFISWRITGDVEDKLFTFVPPNDATEYESLAAYDRAQANRLDRYALLGKKAPEFELTMLDGTQVSPSDFEGKVIVLDFWSTWCGPCLQAMPTIDAECKRAGDDKVVLIAVNVGEFPSHVKGFTGELDWDIPIAVDPKGELAELFGVGKIPLTVLISPTGMIESAHVGFPGDEILSQQFADEFEVLLSGGTIASSEQD